MCVNRASCVLFGRWPAISAVTTDSSIRKGRNGSWASEFSLFSERRINSARYPFHSLLSHTMPRTLGDLAEKGIFRGSAGSHREPNGHSGQQASLTNGIRGVCRGFSEEGVLTNTKMTVEHDFVFIESTPPVLENDEQVPSLSASHGDWPVLRRYCVVDPNLDLRHQNAIRTIQ